jgi:hypothetical protein
LISARTFTQNVDVRVVESRQRERALEIDHARGGAGGAHDQDRMRALTRRIPSQ